MFFQIRRTIIPIQTIYHPEHGLIFHTLIRFSTTMTGRAMVALDPDIIFLFYRFRTNAAQWRKLRVSVL